MAARATPLTPEQIAIARKLRETKRQRANGMGAYQHMCPRQIAKRMGVSEKSVRRALDLERESDMVTNRIYFGAQVRMVVPPEVMAERDRRLNEERSFSAVALGDPPYSQSALGKRNGKTGPETQDGATGEEWPVIARAGGRSKLDRQTDAASQWQRILSRSVPDHSTG